MKNILAAAVMIGCFISSPCLAASKITPDMIQKFLDQSTALTHATNKMSDADIQSFLNTHLDVNGEYKSSVLFEIPGHPATPRNLSFNKQQFINNVVTGRKQMRGYHSTVKLLTHEVSADGKAATIETVTNEQGEMPINPEEYMPFDGTTVCQQTLSLQGDKIILNSAQCEARLGFIE